MKTDFYPKLISGEFYHVYNRGNNRENIFFSKENYRFFLKRYDEYLSDYLDTYAYCLLPNHFHLLVRVKNAEEVTSTRRNTTFIDTTNDKSGISGDTTNIKRGISVKTSGFSLRKGQKEITDVSEIISELFRRFFTSYAKSINKQEGRVGSLFQKNFKRKLIHNEKYFRNVVHYIHANAQMHGIVKDFKEYPYSSYDRILLDAPSKLQKDELVAWFDSKENFIRFHDLGFEKQGDSEAYWIED